MLKRKRTRRTFACGGVGVGASNNVAVMNRHRHAGASECTVVRK